MSHRQPNREDYTQLFRRYGADFGMLYLEPDDQRYALLFEQTVSLLVQESPFNQRLPLPFRNSAARYRAGDAIVVKHLRAPDNRHFMLSDLYDYLQLKRPRASAAADDRARESQSHNLSG